MKFILTIGLIGMNSDNTKGSCDEERIRFLEVCPESLCKAS